MNKIVSGVLAAGLMAAAGAASAQAPGFYVGVEGGVNFLDSATNEKIGPAVGGVIGYDFVGPRIELEGIWRSNKVPGSTVNQYGGFANLVYEFFPASFISPHLGVGAGAVNIKNSGTDFAAQGIAGLTFNFEGGLFARADYKFVNLFNSGRDIRNHTALLTLGIKFGAPAEPPPRPAISSHNGKYVVFFDFDRSNITPTAANTIKAAAAAAKAGKSTRIDVAGHADRSGSDQYNMALSLRRANAVKDQLVREGIPANQIVVVGRGESQPLVNTADGVREPQNRRVEIVLN